MASCAKCAKGFGPGKPVVKALGKAFHKECMVCKDCGVSVLGGGGFVEADGMPQCEPCSEKAANPAASAAVACKKCKKEISANFIKAFGFSFHIYCMDCAVCGKPINNDGFYDDITDKILHLECLPNLK